MDPYFKPSSEPAPMHPALFKLILLRLRGTIRSWLRGLRTWKGALFSVVGALVFGAWLVPQFFSANRFGGSAPMPGGSPGQLQMAMPFMLLAFSALTVFASRTRGAFSFVPAEVLFLFTGPFTRRQVLAYKILTGLVSGAFSALIFSVILSEHFLTWWTAYVGCFLTWLFLDLVPKAVFLLKQSVAEHAYSRGRKMLVAAAIVLILGGCAQSVLTVPPVGFYAFLEGFRQTWAGVVLLAPFEVLSRMLFAETVAPGFLVWASGALAMNLCVVAAILWLDANYLAAAADQSGRNYERLQKMRRGGVFTTAVKSSKAGAWIPPLPWLGGAGPIGWQQLVTAVRTTGLALSALVLLTTCVTPALFLAGVDREMVLFVVWFIFAYSVFFLPMLLRFDFRSALDRVEVLKTLPLPPVAVACGQLITPVLIASAVHAALFLGATPFVDMQQWAIPVSLAYVLPFNLVFFGVENLVFLLFPSAHVMSGTGGFQNMGRAIVTLLIKAALLTALCGPAAALGGIAYWISHGSWLITLVVAWHLLALGAVAVVPCVAWAFERFDPSVDMPA